MANLPCTLRQSLPLSHTYNDKCSEKGGGDIENIIYIDVLIALNIFVTYFLLLSTTALLHQRPRRIRLICGAAFGGFSSLLILLDPLPFLLLCLIKLILGIIIVLISFSYKNKKLFAKSVVFFLLVNMAYGGFMFALWFFIAPSNMYYHNGVAYFNISALLLCISTIAAYFFIKAVKYLLDRRIKRQDLYRVIINVQENQVTLSAFYDSGNHLKDPFSGKSIVVCEFSSVKALFPQSVSSFFSDDSNLNFEHIPEEWKKRVRIVPFQVIKHEGSLKCFLPDRCFIINDTEQLQAEVLIGVTETSLSDGEYHALLPSDILNS